MPLSAPARRRLTIAGLGAAGAVAAPLVAAFLLLSFGWNLLRPAVARRLSAAIGRPVEIARIRRVGLVSLHPRLAIEGVRIVQPAWAGRGDMLRLRAATVRLPILPLLVGRVRPELIAITGARLALVRGTDGRTNWEREEPHTPSGAPPPRFGHVVIRDGIVSMDDRVGDRRLVARVSSDAGGFRMTGHGTIAGSPARLAMTGPTVAGDGPWPFHLEVVSARVAARLDGRSATPLDTGHFTARMVARGNDLRDLDRLIQAGLPATQPFHLAATVRHDRPAWFVTGLAGTLGRSNLTGDISIHKPEGRTVLQGSLSSTGFDFDDLSSSEGLAQAAALARRLGPRLLPNTPIDLTKLRRTDGTLRIHVARVLSRTPTVFRAVDGTLTLDHGVLTAAPVVARMAAGQLTGSLTVRHHAGTPLLTLDLRLRRSRLAAMVNARGIIDGPLEGHARLAGHGATIRAAVGRATGTVGLVLRNGSMGRRVALLLGTDVGRGLFTGHEQQVAVRCAIGRFTVAGGIARPAPAVIDTAVARADGSGRVTLADERIALQLQGTPKRASILRLSGPFVVGGTLELPTINPPPLTKTPGGVLKILAHALGGHPATVAGDADCAGLAARALR